jgi:peptide subunit release factor RF-3
MAPWGIEEQTRKLFEVCRLRDVPILTFVNKLDREGRDPFDLLGEIEQGLALDVTPASWPIGMGRDFLGTFDLFADALLSFERGVHDRVAKPVRCRGLDDPKLLRLWTKSRTRQIARGHPAFAADQNRWRSLSRTTERPQIRGKGEPVGGVIISTAPSVLVRVTPLGPK